MKDMETSNQHDSLDLSHQEWKIISTELPAKRRGRRNVLNAVMHLERVGGPWASMPERYGNYRTLYWRCHQWALGGVWDAELELLAKLGCLEDWKRGADGEWLKSLLFEAASQLRNNRRPAQTISQATRDHLENERRLEGRSNVDQIVFGPDATRRDFS